MVDETLTQRLDTLLNSARTDASARAELNGLINKEVYVEKPNPVAQNWLVRIMAKSPHEKVRVMALHDQNEGQKRCAGLALVEQALHLYAPHERVDILMEIVKTPGFHEDARVKALKTLDVELNRTTGEMAKMRMMKELLLGLEGGPQAVKEAIAEAFGECALRAGENISLVKSMVVQSGKYGEVAVAMGKKLVDHNLRTGNPKEVESIADDPKTPYKVVAYACAKLGRQVPKPRGDDNEATLTGMQRPALADWIKRAGTDMERAKAANGAANGTPDGGKPKAQIRR